MSPILTHDEFADKLRAEMAAYDSPPPNPAKWATIGGFRQFTRVNSHAVYGVVYGDPRQGFEAFLGPDLPDAELGAVARQALAASRFITPDDPDWEMLSFGTRESLRADDAALKRRAGVKTLKALYEGAGSVALKQEDGMIEVIPDRYRGNSCWDAVPGHVNSRLPEGVSDNDLGAAINAAMTISRAA